MMTLTLLLVILATTQVCKYNLPTLTIFTLYFRDTTSFSLSASDGTCDCSGQKGEDDPEDCPKMCPECYDKGCSATYPDHQCFTISDAVNMTNCISAQDDSLCEGGKSIICHHIVIVAKIFLNVLHQ